MRTRAKERREVKEHFMEFCGTKPIFEAFPENVSLRMMILNKVASGILKRSN